jgi:predicted RNA-binding protein
MALCAGIDSSVWNGTWSGAHGENGVVIIGVNPKSRTLSGYYESSDVTGRVTAECKFFFSGEIKAQNAVNVQIITAHPDFLEEKSKTVSGKVELQSKSDHSTLVIYPEQIPRSCDWLYSGLPSYVPPSDFTLENGLHNEIKRKGDWQAVNIIRSKRAYFYAQPNDRSRGKTYVVIGDLVYIYDENPDWYYVKYLGAKKEITGWIKKIDTLQPHPNR